MNKTPLWKTLYPKNPYADFPLDNFTPDIQGWGDPHPIFVQVIEKIRPNLIIEVGTWKGYSALFMAHLLDKFKCNGHIICIDTFLGSPEHFLDPSMNQLMKVKNGFPTLYPQFLANVLFEKREDTIVPLPQTSEGAFHILHRMNITADMIYIDGDHHYDSVSRDLRNFWTLLRPGGVVLGDDYDEQNWPDVFKAANEFSERTGVRLYGGSGKYLIEKPH